MRALPDAAIFLIVLALVSLGVWGNGFVRDDFLFFRAADCDLSLASVSELFKQCYFHETGEIFYYRPLSRLFYRVENFFFQADPMGYHAVSLILFAAFLCALNAVIKPWIPGRLARLTGLIWIGLHPLTHSYWVYMTGIVDILPLLLTCLAVLGARRGDGAGVLISLGLCTLASFSKEVGVFSYAIVAWELWRAGQGRLFGRFLAGALLTGGAYLWIRSQVASTPAVGSYAEIAPLILALCRESLWTPLQTVLRPDLCQMEYSVLAEFPMGTVLLCGALLVWAGAAFLAYRRRWRPFLPLAFLFLAFWFLNIFNMYFSIELSSENKSVHLLYIPDHLQFVPLACLILPLTQWLCQSRHGRLLALAAAILTAGVGALKVGEWRNEITLFEAIIRREPLLSRPYRVLALRQLEARDLEGAIHTLNLALTRGFKNSELYHLASKVAEKSGDTAMQASMASEGARRAILESMLELPIILRNPEGKTKARIYLGSKSELFPKEEWFRKQAEILK